MMSGPNLLFVVVERLLSFRVGSHADGVICRGGLVAGRASSGESKLMDDPDDELIDG